MFLSIGGLLLYHAFEGIKLDALLEGLKSAEYSWVLLSLVLATVQYVSRAYRWKLLIEPLGYKPSLSNCFYAESVGYLANIAFPRMGEVTKCATLNRREKVPINSLLGTVVIERFFDLLIVIASLLIVVIINFDKFGLFFIDKVFAPFSNSVSNGLSPIVIIGLSLTILIIGLIYWKLRKKIHTLKIYKSIKQLLTGVKQGLKTVSKMKKRRYFYLHTFIIWGMYWAMTWVVVFSLESTSHLTPVDGLFLLVISGIGMIIPSPGGIGSFHFIVSLGLTTVYGIGRADAAIYSTIVHESQTVIILVLGAFSLIAMFMSRKKKSVPIPKEDKKDKSKKAKDEEILVA